MATTWQALTELVSEPECCLPTRPAPTIQILTESFMWFGVLMDITSVYKHLTTKYTKNTNRGSNKKSIAYLIGNLFFL